MGTTNFDTVAADQFVGALTGNVTGDVTGQLAIYAESVYAVSQSGTNAPVLTEIVDQHGATLTPSYDGAGEYGIAADSGVWSSTKTVVHFTTSSDNALFFTYEMAGTSEMIVYTKDSSATPANGLLAGFLVIRTYI
jgi:hypothetical protein